MEIDFQNFVLSLSKAHDMVDREALGVQPNCGERLAVLAHAISHHLEMTEYERLILTTKALLLDRNLIEALYKEHQKAMVDAPVSTENVNRATENIFRYDITLYLFYWLHSETLNGRKPFIHHANKIPIDMEIISFVNYLAAQYQLGTLDECAFTSTKEAIMSRIRNSYSREVCDSFGNAFTPELGKRLHDGHVHTAAASIFPRLDSNLESAQIMELVQTFAGVIDYKSRFTRKHSVQIAARTWLMSTYYKFDEETKLKLFLAAALHDAGKLYVPKHLLEKRGKLDVEEFEIVKSHVWYTFELLKEIKGFEDICTWASNHHEKLDGTGYPFGKGAAELDTPSRLLACIDVYQAVSEERPYHAGRSHAETMEILFDMARSNKLDGDIVADLNVKMEGFFPDVLIS